MPIALLLMSPYGSDRPARASWPRIIDFNSRPIRGTISLVTRVVVTTLFQLMPHAGAIDAVEHHVVLVEISTYAPRVGSDPAPCRIMISRSYFNSRSPCGERPRKWDITSIIRTTFPYRQTLEYRNHAKLGTLCCFQTSVKSKYSIHAPIVHKYKVRTSPGKDENYRLAPRKLHSNTIKTIINYLFQKRNIDINCKICQQCNLLNYYNDCNISFTVFFHTII